MSPHRRARTTGRLLQWYYHAKYRPFARERRPADSRRGLIVLQIDALAYSDLRRALRRGSCPTLARLLRSSGFSLRRWFCGLPAATPYCQAGIFHGENSGIPAFRFYDKSARRVITCNEPAGVQYIRDRISTPGALAGGSSYVNLLDGDAQTVAFTVATRERMSVFGRLGGRRMLLLMSLHPIRLARIAVESVIEWLLEEWERLRGEIAGRATHSEGMFPFVRILTNVIVRELQTMAILLDVYLGVPVIYSTFMQYDELAHHFGPSSPQALGDLRRTDSRISEILRMVRTPGGRAYDVVILSDHGMTPARSYRVEFGESLGATIQRVLDGDVFASHGESSEYAPVGPEAINAMADAAGERRTRAARSLRRIRDWLRSRYGIREIVIPEKYRLTGAHDVVATYSSCLALVYFAADPRRLDLSDIRADPRWNNLYDALLAHPGIGLILTRQNDAVYAADRAGCARIQNASMELIEGRNPLDAYGTERHVLAAIESLVLQPNSGDLVLFGAYDGREIVSFDDQVGAHGSAGGDQVYPFILTPPAIDLSSEVLEDARDIHRVLMSRYAGSPARGSEAVA